MRFIILYILICLPLALYAQKDSITRYENGAVKYVETYEGPLVMANTYLSPGGDTIYSWDARKAEITERSPIGEFLLKREYDSINNQPGLSMNPSPAEKMALVNSQQGPAINAQEWRRMHDVFYLRCPDYKRTIREGDFTVELSYEDKVPSGPFEKYYRGQEVVKGQYKQGRRSGIWIYHPYRFYPYFDITFFTSVNKEKEREWSILYFELPALLSVLLFVVAGRIAAKRRAYHHYYYCVIITALTMLLLRLGIPYTRDNMIIRFVIPALWFTSWHTMVVLATVNIFLGRRTKTRTIVNIFFLLAGLSFSLYVLFFKYLDF